MIDDFNTDFNELFKDGKMCDTPFFVLPKAGLEKVPVPCGRCPPCKLRRVNSWVFRMLQESKISSSSYFITLTYDTRFVPISQNGFMTLKKSDFQDYMKRLRKLNPNETLKYYAVGEYGTNNRRPHYHAILFNVSDPDDIAKAWSLDGVPIGGVHVGKTTSDSIAYCMKYLDKMTGTKLHDRDDRQPEFPLMSKGIGKNYLSDEIVNYHKADITRLFATKEGGHKIALPRYYREKIYSEKEMKQQVVVIQSLEETKRANQLLEFQRMEYDPEYTFEQYEESQRLGRYAHHYSNQKIRDV